LFHDSDNPDDNPDVSLDIILADDIHQNQSDKSG
jgi:hypothetical protein